MKKLNKDNKGFSLVELLVVIAIMVVLVGVIAPTLLKNIEKARVAADVQTLDAIAGAIQDAIGSDEKSYTEAMNIAGTAYYSVEKLYSGTINSEKDVEDLTKTVSDYLAKSKIAFKGTDAKASYTADKNNLQFNITKEGTITVKLLDKTGNDMDSYSVTR